MDPLTLFGLLTLWIGGAAIEIENPAPIRTSIEVKRSTSETLECRLRGIATCRPGPLERGVIEVD